MKDSNRNYGLSHTSDISWLNDIRAVAILGIISHHILLYVPHQNLLAFDLIQTFSGTFVHLFFIISGIGLTMSAFKKKNVSWHEWSKKRFLKIVFPYWIITIIIFYLMNLSHLLRPDIFKIEYSHRSLLAYLTFTRNSYDPSWELNPPMWFMPVIVGLYMVFPFLISVLKKFGMATFILLSVFLTYGSISFYLLMGIPASHQAAPFMFFISEFSTGMVIAYLLVGNSIRMNTLLGYRSFLTGAGFYAISWLIRQYWSYGEYFNDTFTAIGIFIIVLNVNNWVKKVGGNKLDDLFSPFSLKSYPMYLIHFPVLSMMISLYSCDKKSPDIGILSIIVFYIIFVCVVYYLSKMIWRPIGLWLSSVID